MSHMTYDSMPFFTFFQKHFATDDKYGDYIGDSIIYIISDDAQVCASLRPIFRPGMSPSANCWRIFDASVGATKFARTFHYVGVRVFFLVALSGLTNALWVARFLGHTERGVDGWMEMTLSLTTHVSLFLTWSNYVFFQRYQSLQTIRMTTTNLARWSISSSSMWTRSYPLRQKPSNSSAANAEQLALRKLVSKTREGKNSYFNAVKNYVFALMHSVPVGFGFELWHMLQYWFKCTILE